MKASNTLIATLREVPAEAVIASHQLMLRAGLIRKLGNGLFTYFPLGLKGVCTLPYARASDRLIRHR